VLVAKAWALASEFGAADSACTGLDEVGVVARRLLVATVADAPAPCCRRWRSCRVTCGGGCGRSAAVALSHLPVIEALPLDLARECCDGGSMNYLCEVDPLDVPVLIGGQEHARPLTTGMKLMLIVASTLVFLVGIQLFVLTEHTDRYFAWTVNPPLTAAALGGAYLASSVMELLASRQRTWAQARIAVPAVLMFTTLTLVTTFLHLDRFHLGHRFAVATQVVTWVWIAVYALVPVLMSILLVFQRRASGVEVPRRNSLPRWLRVILGLHAVVMFSLGLGLFLGPGATLALWPWMLTPLTARAIGAWLLGLGLAAAHATAENDWGRVAVATHSYVLLGVLEFVALIRYPNTVDWGRPATWVYVLFLVSVLLVGVYGWITTTRTAHRSTVSFN
jgi:hypothetical protein